MENTHKKPETEKERLARMALEQIRAVYEDKKATINGRDYEFTVTSHQQRVKVFAFLSKVRPELERHNMAFLDTKEWQQVEATINNIIMFDGSLLSRRPTHWEEYPEDYLLFVSTALQVISFPLYRGNLTA